MARRGKPAGQGTVRSRPKDTSIAPRAAPLAAGRPPAARHWRIMRPRTTAPRTPRDTPAAGPSWRPPPPDRSNRQVASHRVASFLPRILALNRRWCFTAPRHAAAIEQTHMDRTKPSFQELILRLHDYWSAQGCVILQP